MCDYCNTGVYVENNVTYEHYMYCPQCGKQLDETFWIFYIDKINNIVLRDEKSTRKSFYSLLKDNNLKYIHMHDRPTDSELYMLSEGTIVVCENRCCAFVIMLNTLNREDIC